MSCYAIILIAVWLSSGMYGGFLVFWSHRTWMEILYNKRPRLNGVDAIFIFICCPPTGLVGLFMGALLYFSAKHEARKG